MKALRKELYMMTQVELIEFINRELMLNDIEFKTDKLGNIWSIQHKDAPIFVAHMDTVIANEDNYKIPLLEENGKLSRPGYILGADDRAGVNLILNHKKRINFVLTVDEEIGAIGANALALNDEFIDDVSNGTFFIELDRRGGNDVLGNLHGYCSKECVNAVLEVATGFSEAVGVFTDIDAWVSSICQGINLSVGYYSAHSNKEYLNIKEFNYVDSLIIPLSKIKGHRAVFEKPKKSYTYLKGNYDYGYSYNYGRSYTSVGKPKVVDRCDFCGQYDTVETYKGYKICNTCAIGAEDDKDDVYQTPKCSCCGHKFYQGETVTTVKGLGMRFCDDCITIDWEV